MYDLAIIWDWIAFSVRWLHVITAMAWIGASFYFIALDLMLKPAPDMPEGAYGEEWEVHGGGFYHTTKYLVAPARLPEHLTWHKWQSYTTWLSGAALLMIVYWVGGELFLLDPTKADLALWQGIVISGGSLTIGWIAYDQLCKSRLGENPTALMLILFVILVAMAWGYDQIFTGRAALLHLGAFTATIMTANVFFQIMPNQRIVVADLKAGRTPDAKYGKIAKLRSTHNNYLTLPVVFLMLSNHYPLAFGTEYSWLIASLIFLTGVTIRHYFNTMHKTGKGPHWTWFVTVLLMILIAWLSTVKTRRNMGRGRGAPADRLRTALCRGRRVRGCLLRGGRKLFHVPCPRTGLGQHALGTQGRLPGNPRATWPARPGRSTCRQGSAMPCRRPTRSRWMTRRGR